MTISFAESRKVDGAFPSTGRAERYLLRAWTGVDMPFEEARDLLPRVLAHRERMRHWLGRDPGLRVAAVDYFENVLGRLPPSAFPYSARSATIGSTRAARRAGR